MASEGHGIPEVESTPNDILSGIVEAIKGLVEVVMAHTESTRMVLQHMWETQDRNNNHNGEGNGNSIGANLCYQGLYEEIFLYAPKANLFLALYHSIFAI